MTDTFVLDPRDWITPPYRTCPACGADEFGVLMMADHRYFRRCRACMTDESFALPPLEKKVLYLDQFAISNLMKVIHPDHRERVAERDADDAGFWIDLFARLDRLVKLNLLACPSSLTHWEESVASASLYAGL